jgi:hypothetical protein
MISNGTLQDGCDERHDVRFRKRWRCLLRVIRVALTAANHFRSTPISGHSQWPSACLKGTNRVILAIGRPLPVFPRERTSSGRPGTSEKCQNRKSRLHSITLSAWAINPAGISRPSSFAALRLMTRSQWVSRKYGISAGSPPLRTSTICAAVRRIPAFMSKA